MPQIDKVTIFMVVFWLTLLYVFQYLLLSISHFQVFINSFKLKVKRVLHVVLFNALTRRYMKSILIFPWIFDAMAE